MLLVVVAMGWAEVADMLAIEDAKAATKALKPCAKNVGHDEEDLEDEGQADAGRCWRFLCCLHAVDSVWGLCGLA